MVNFLPILPLRFWIQNLWINGGVPTPKIIIILLVKLLLASI